jgi:phospholipid/cholesterol/gamma-HCH transport system permease protein
MQAQEKIGLHQPAPDLLRVTLSGRWLISGQIPPVSVIRGRLESAPDIRSIAFDSGELIQWDSSLLNFIRVVADECEQRSIAMATDGLPKGLQRLLQLTATQKTPASVAPQQKHKPFLYMVGESAVHFWTSAHQMLGFIGEAALSFVNFLLGKARFRRIDLLIFIEECGANSLPIITLISVLVGLILGFVGAVQLKLFGAQVYVANLVAIAMAREMGALMTGVIISGRIGAAYAAQLGTMQVNEEIDALSTMGIPPMEFLVLPRLLALVLMMPLLALYADMLGILGGAIVGVGAMDIPLIQYLNQTRDALNLTNIWLGVAKAGIYAIIIALSGCMRGMQSGRSAAAVGDAATSAVVTALVGIIVTDGIFAVLCDALGI